MVVNFWKIFYGVVVTAQVAHGRLLQSVSEGKREYQKEPIKRGKIHKPLQSPHLRVVHTGAFGQPNVFMATLSFFILLS